MLNRSASLAISTSVLKALPGKLDIKRHLPSILYVFQLQAMNLLDEMPNLCTIVTIVCFLTGSITAIKSHDNLKNASKVSNVRLPLPVHEKGLTLESRQCPTSRCHCQEDSQTKRPIINCRYQQLSQIPAFEAVDTVYYEITFSMDNHITEIPYLAFRNLKVERIDLLKNSLVSIFPGAFSGLEKHLKELLIEGNGNILPPYAKLTNLKKLRTLRLQKFQQNSIGHENEFGSFPELENLQIYNFVTLSSIDGLAFQNKLQNLKRLEIINSYLSSFPVQSLTHLTSLKELYLKDSKITTIYSRSFEQLHNLSELDISYNKITMLEEDAFVGVAKTLHSLDLTFNELEPESLAALSSKTWTKLQQLTLSYNNKLGTMPEKVFVSMPALQYLYLVQINLRQVSRNLFSGLKELRGLDLSWNKIETIEAGAFQHMSYLHELKLNKQYGSQTHVPSDFAMRMSPYAFYGSEKSLSILNLEYTPVIAEQFWSIIRTLTNIETFKLSKTGLSSIPDFGFIYNTNLKEIELENNGIGTLTPDSFTGPTDTLQKVLLNSNHISSINNCVFQKHKQISAICLANNPLNCDCTIYWLYKFIAKTNHHFGPCFSQDYICATPQPYENQALTSLHLNVTCSSHMPDNCIYKNITITTSTPATSETTTPLETPTDSTHSKVNELTLTIASRTLNSITIAWNIKYKSGVSGFILEYHATADKFVTTINIHRDEFLYTIHNLRSGIFYSMCVTAEINQARDITASSCRTTQTDSSASETDKQSGNDVDETDDDKNARNILIGVILGSSVFIILVVTGVYLVIKYKIQKLKTIQLSLNHLDRRLAEEVGKVCTVSNEYTAMEEMKKAKRYHTIGETQRQRRRKNDATYINDNATIEVNDEGTEPEPLEDESNNQECMKQDLVLRHSAPSRLNAVDLLKDNNAKITSRPLPATPHGDQIKGDQKSPIAANVITTQVSVYDRHKNNDSVYQELP